MNLDHDFFQMSKLSEDQKNRSSPKMKHFFSPTSGEDQKKKGLLQRWNTFFPRNQMEICAQMHTRVKLLEGMQMKTVLKFWGGYSQIIGGYILPGFRHPWLRAWVWNPFGQSIFLSTLRQTQLVTWTYFLLFCWVMKQFNEFFEYIWKSYNYLFFLKHNSEKQYLNIIYYTIFFTALHFHSVRHQSKHSRRA